MAADNPTPEQVATALSASLSLLHRRLHRPLGPGELTLPERSALSRLDRGGASTASVLAAREQISPQSMGATLASLKERGLISREPDPSDGRRMIVSLTRAGKAAVKAKRAERNQTLTNALRAEFTDAERLQLLQSEPLLRRLADAL